MASIKRSSVKWLAVIKAFMRLGSVVMNRLGFGKVAMGIEMGLGSCWGDLGKWRRQRSADGLIGKNEVLASQVTFEGIWWC